MVGRERRSCAWSDWIDMSLESEYEREEGVVGGRRRKIEKNELEMKNTRCYNQGLKEKKSKVKNKHVAEFGWIK